MDRYEARLAVQLNAICENGGTRYYAYGLQYTKEPGKLPHESIVLHDLKANSITYADYEKTTVVDWRSAPKYVEQKLAAIREKQAQDQSKQ